MSIKQILSEAGISHIVPVNQLWQSWPITMRLVEASGGHVRPLKIGTRRVVLATQNPIGKRFRLLPVLAILIALAIGFVSLMPRETPSSHLSTFKRQNCIAIEAGAPISKQAANYVSGDWSLTLDSIAVSGNIESFNFEAKCREEKVSGVLIAALDSGMLRIKKLTPAK